jgi:hypothetical protein
MDLTRRTAGVLLHVTSLPGPHGIGDFGPDAYRLRRLAGLGRPGPLAVAAEHADRPGRLAVPEGVGAFAGSQWMVALEPLVERGWLSRPELPEGGFDARHVDFGRVLPWREAQLRAAAAGFAKSATPADREAHSAWCAAQADWLDDYALFMAHGARRTNGQPWWEWPDAAGAPRAGGLAAARIEYASEVGFWQFVQWCFDTQCAALKAYANAHGVSLMGDLPIFIAHDSADCWARPDLYCWTSLPAHRGGRRAARRPGAAGPALGQPAVPLGPHGSRRLRLVDSAGEARAAPAPMCSASTTSAASARLLGDPGQQPRRQAGPLAAGAGQALVRRHRKGAGPIAHRRRRPGLHHARCA